MDDDTKRRSSGEERAAAAKSNDNSVTVTMARQVLRRDESGLWGDFLVEKDSRLKGPIPLSFLLSLPPELCTALAEGYALHCLKRVKSSDRRYIMAMALRHGFVTYVAQLPSDCPDISDIDESFLHRFKAWIDDTDRDGFSASLMTRANMLAALQLPLAALMASREWKPRLSPKLRLIRRPYPNTARDVEHTPTLNEPDYERLYAGAAIDIANTVKRRGTQMDAMERLNGEFVTLAEAGRSPEACAAWLDAQYEHPVPSYYEMGRASASYVQSVPAFIHEEAEHILYPDMDELVPMILVVCAFFALNPSTAFKLRKGGRDYKITTFGDLRRLRMYPHKKRASLRQRNIVTVTDHPDNPGQILQYLERRTRRLGLARPELAKRAFLRFSFRMRKTVAFDNSDHEWRAAVKRFADRHGMQPFTLDQLRPTTLDLVHELSGGNIIAMQGVATHTTVQTTYTFYTSDAQRRRNRERLGEMLMQMERWSAMGGKIRPDDRPHGIAEHAAATPGFSCLDPKDSPIDGEVRGELCTAYGRCPECPLAVVDPSSPRALAYLIMLNDRINDAESKSVDPVAWHMRWAPVREELITYWLRGWPKEIEEQARALPIPKLPPVE